MFRATEGRWGSREVEITEVTLLGPDGQPSHVFQSGEPHGDADPPARPDARRRLRLRRRTLQCRGRVLLRHEHLIEELNGRAAQRRREADFSIESLDLVEGTYKLDVAVHKYDGYPYDYHRLLYTFRVKSRAKDVGIYRPRHAWRFSGDMRFKKTAQ